VFRRLYSGRQFDPVMRILSARSQLSRSFGVDAPPAYSALSPIGAVRPCQFSVYRKLNIGRRCGACEARGLDLPLSSRVETSAFAARSVRSPRVARRQRCLRSESIRPDAPPAARTAARAERRRIKTLTRHNARATRYRRRVPRTGGKKQVVAATAAWAPRRCHRCRARKSQHPVAAYAEISAAASMPRRHWRHTQRPHHRKATRRTAFRRASSYPQTPPRGHPPMQRQETQPATRRREARYTPAPSRCRHRTHRQLTAPIAPLTAPPPRRTHHKRREPP
jgi:hypothetical protein